MPQLHVVQKGESLSRIAARYGFGSDWEALYQAPENAVLRQKRPDARLVQPGDHVLIPNRKTPAGTGQAAQKTEDLLQRAQTLSAEYLRLRERYILWVSDKTRANWVVIAEWTRILAAQDKEKLGSRVNQQVLQGFLEKNQTEAGQYIKPYETKALELVKLMRGAPFRKQFDALPGDDRVQWYADLTEGFNESHVGRTFILEELKKSEKQDPTALLTGVFKVAKEANGAFWKFLAEFSPTIVMWKQSQARVYMEQLIVQRVTHISVDKLRKRVNLYQTTTIVYTRQAFNVDLLTAEHILLKDAPKMQRIGGLMNKAFETFNLAFALNEARKNLGAKEMLSTLGALAGLLEQFTVVTRALQAKNLMRTAIGKATEASVLAIVAGVCDAVTGGMDAYDRYSKGDYDAMTVYAVGAAGGAAAAVGASLVVFGASTFWTGAGVVVLLVGAVVSVGAAVASLVGDFDDSPVQLWLKNNRFGTRGHKPAPEFREWKDNPTRQIEALHKALAPIEFSGDFSEDGHTLVLKPAMVLTCSRVLVTIRATWSLGTYQYWRDQPLDSRYHTMKVEGDRVTEITLKVPQPPSRGDSVLYTSIKVEVAVDVYNDRKTMTYRREAELTPSMMERVFSWF